MIILRYSLPGAAAFAGAALLIACEPSATDPAATDPAATDRAAADIGLVADSDRRLQEITTPPGYQQGHELISYEGPGWESDKVAFRLYLDGRNALDIFGKKTHALVLSQTVRRADYHTMNDWGMDILKVGASLGAGGLGVVENNNVRQIGEAGSYKAKISEDTVAAASVRVSHIGSLSCGGDMVIEYTIEAQQRMTNVQVLSPCALPRAAGLVIHPDTDSINSSGSDGDWQYIARYGAQSLAGDALGLALFYRNSEVIETGQDMDDDYVVFKSSSLPVYKTAAAWEQEPGGLKDIHAFREWLHRTQLALNQDSQ